MPKKNGNANNVWDKNRLLTLIEEIENGYSHKNLAEKYGCTPAGFRYALFKAYSLHKKYSREGIDLPWKPS